MGMEKRAREHAALPLNGCGPGVVQMAETLDIGHDKEMERMVAVANPDDGKMCWFNRCYCCGSFCMLDSLLFSLLERGTLWYRMYVHKRLRLAKPVMEVKTYPDSARLVDELKHGYHSPNVIIHQT